MSDIRLMYESLDEKCTDLNLKVYICYEFDESKLPSEFQITSSHNTILPKTTCSCDEIVKENERRYYVNQSLLQCEGWRLRCLLLRAAGLIKDLSDNSDPDIYNSCRPLHDLYETMTYDELEIFLHLISFFEATEFTWTNINQRLIIGYATNPM